MLNKISANLTVENPDENIKNSFKKELKTIFWTYYGKRVQRCSAEIKKIRF